MPSANAITHLLAAPSRRRRLSVSVAVLMAVTLLGAGVVSAPHASASTPDGHWWGVDTSVPITATSLANIQSAAGGATPQVWLRYIVDCVNTGFCTNESASEIALAERSGIYTSFLAADSGGDTGASNGTADGQRTVSAARNLSIPSGALLFKDLEGANPTDAAFLQAWYQAVIAGGYTVGYYSGSSNFSSAYCAAVSAVPAMTGAVIDTPDGGNYGAGPSAAPAFSNTSDWPSCGGSRSIWQYSLGKNAGGTSYDQDEIVPNLPGLLAPDGTVVGGADATRIAVLTSDGTALVKEGAVNSAFVVEASSARSIAVDGSRIATVLNNNALEVKDGALNAPWTVVANNAAQAVIAGSRIGFIDTSGRAYVKDGDLNAPFTLVATGAAKMAMSGARLAVIASDGTLRVKDGPLTAGWVVEGTNVTAVSLSGNRVGAVIGSVGQVKEGDLTSPWTVEANAAADILVSGTRIGVVDTTGGARVKDGALTAPWVEEASGVTKLALGGTRIGEVGTDGTVQVKDGALTATWTLVANGGSSVGLSQA